MQNPGLLPAVQIWSDRHENDGALCIVRTGRTETCGKGPSFGVAGTKTAEYSAQHAPDKMVNVYSRKCRTESCGKEPSFGVAGTKTVEYCA